MAAKAIKVYGTFHLTLEGNATASELVHRGRYNWHHRKIADRRFPIQQHNPMDRTVKLIEFDHDPISEEVLAEFTCRGLECPIPEDAFYFGIQHPDEQRKRSIVFPHEPVYCPDGHRYVLVLRAPSGIRGLYLYQHDYRWLRCFVFAGVRPISGT
jgi:hypothetical protein